MNGKPQLVFGQAQFTRPDTLMNKANYAKPSILPVGKGNSFASILSSTVDKSTPASTPVAGKLMPGGQGSFLGGASLFGTPTPSGQAVQGDASLMPLSLSNDRQVNTRQMTAAQGGEVTKIGGATVQATTQANTVAKRVSAIPKNYSFGMEDTRPGAARASRNSSPGQAVGSSGVAQSVKPATGSYARIAAGATKKTPDRAQNVPSARTINVAAMHGKNTANTSFPITEQFMAGNGTFRDTPYRGLAISRSSADKSMLNPLRSKGGGKADFYSPLLAGGATQLLMQIVKEVGHVAGTVGDMLQLKKASPPARSASEALDRERHTNVAEKAGRPVKEKGLSVAVEKQLAAMQAGASSGVSAAGNGMALDAGFLGALSAKFESGESGIAAIGYDRHGGTSYGKYQISSRAGTFTKFLEYLEVNAPDIEAKLRAGGPANTGGRRGKMPEVWKSIAESEPARFEQLQTDFIMSSHFQPAMDAITEATGLAFGAMPEALREVVFSTAVQHGVAGAARIVSRAVASVGAEKLTDGEKAFVERTGQDLIRQIYSIRARQFSSSTSSVRRAVQNRLQHEMHDALALLRINPLSQRPDTRHMPVG